MDKYERLELLKQIEKDIHVCSLESTFEDDAKSCALHSAIEELEQRWIPVSEKLPKDGQKVLVTTRSGNIIDVDTSIFYHASAFWKHYVIAWMPLPESFKESEDKE